MAIFNCYVNIPEGMSISYCLTNPAGLTDAVNTHRLYQDPRVGKRKVVSERRMVTQPDLHSCTLVEQNSISAKQFFLIITEIVKENTKHNLPRSQMCSHFISKIDQEQ